MKWMTLLMLLCLSMPLRANDDRLSLTFDDAPVERILQALADYQQTNLLIAPGVEGRLSLRLDNVGWDRALALVTQLAKLTVVQEEGVLLVYPESWQQLQVQQEKEEREEEKQQTPLEQQTVTLHYASASDIYRSLQAERSLMTPRGSVTVDSRTNSLLLRDTAEALRDTERWLKALDLPLEQVELTAHIVTINEEHLRELGVNWGTSPAEVVTQALRNPLLEIPLAVSNPAFRAGVTLGQVSGELLNLELSALEQENQIEIIASPRLFTSHQQTASIKQGTEIPYEVKSGNSGATAIEFKEAVLGMEVTPVVLGNGRIQLKLRLSQNLPGRSLNIGDNQVLSIDKQEIETQVTLRDGETLALGGIFQQQRSQSEKRVPWLGDLPLLGNLFRQQTDEQKKKELVIFITPRLVREAALTAG
ncbi:protein transport protein HofQ [Candidatus Pantoea symbiotica]|jgi:protein transport protein HofQ|uniref:Protein transport protein HofQ n=1 Tax=Candidatus Pantoea symbiotica TaxID=1884370 RepID=A0A1I4DZH2_9GAMM|nr:MULTISPECIES: DNA uptake porin HofQ [Pantoea]KAJ9431499.1 DNA uptake porin HofQ [Pantoea sp. YR343]MRT26484.1 DNA uptake porin HofQ [Enterobacteriaceae bacterium RIT697]SFK97506.1 protein transport protein HofQ [Pantoea symbiotica]SFV06684.1 protein transport protein HofQ [Pantoea sp. YR525]